MVKGLGYQIDEAKALLTKIQEIEQAYKDMGDYVDLSWLRNSTEQKLTDLVSQIGKRRKR